MSRSLAIRLRKCYFGLHPRYPNIQLPMSEDLFLSNAFSQSMRPLKVVPYCYRASRTFEQHNISITTLVTFNRFKVFSEFVTHYQGPISATVHVKPSATHALLNALHDLYASTPAMASLDAKIDRILKEGHAAFVEVTEWLFLSLVKAKKIDVFHRTWAPGHNGTDYPRFYSVAPGEVYMVTQYHPTYEPGAIFRKEGPPCRDERFVGYEGNKAACLYEMYLSSMSFYFLADHFLVHQSHAYEEARTLDDRLKAMFHGIAEVVSDGYDEIDVQACKERGNIRFQSESTVANVTMVHADLPGRISYHKISTVLASP
ncbi:hypothetical protein DFJ58DRAFT_847237 [Suillus subalutaceus]|uniref:uncharacterized protein n=1 Tax=Suillus subalutaceus TaxID=48586 RepID=UPI001B884D47|nr:uncharacterized protein DFJ58DRAFT_847237 [Suillus subalutaceus]KAG1835988.1 hypothetical protein DFJ58DRAFT_847237 [Suillus subalutaceus]